MAALLFALAMILQQHLPYDPMKPRPLPGIAALAPEEWLLRDEAFAGQMARRDALVIHARDAVIAMQEAARPAAEELLQEVLGYVQGDPGYGREGGVILRPDGVRVPLDHGDPMGTVARLVQEDLLILEKRGQEHVLVAAALCFPASWSLKDKFGHPMVRIHDPVEEYDTRIARAVQRMFDGVAAGARPFWRFNALWYADPELHAPRRENDRREERFAERADFLRSERQTIRRLDRTGALVFGIHTYVLARADVKGA